MTLDFTCQDCDATFELELSDILEDPSSVQCPSCEARAPRAAVDGMASALDDLFAQLALLRRKFAVQMEVDSEDLPATYEQETVRSKDEDEDEEDGGWSADGDEEDAEEAGLDEDEDER